MYLAFDTETTDLPRPHLEPDHLAQTNLLQSAGVLFDGKRCRRNHGRIYLTATHLFNWGLAVTHSRSLSRDSR